MTESRELRAEAASDPFRGFQTLMPYRVRDILMVSSLYDSYTLQEEGRLLPVLQEQRFRAVLNQGTDETIDLGHLSPQSRVRT